LNTLATLDLPIEEIREIIKEARKIMTVKEKTVTELYKLGKKYKIFCISNMSHKSWDIVKQNSFVSAFKDVVISAQVKHIKPEIEIYQKALKQFNIIPEESVFIDDLKENIYCCRTTGDYRYFI
jgi:putative hydrolase of the HAD superfamily